MSHSEYQGEPVKLIKSGDAYAFPLSKKDQELLNADCETIFEKIISPDGNEVTFRKVEVARPEVLKVAREVINEKSELMKRLEDY